MLRGGGRGDGRHLWITFVQMRAIVVRFDATRGFGGIDVESVQVGADVFYWAEALDGFDDCKSPKVDRMK